MINVRTIVLSVGFAASTAMVGCDAKPKPAPPAPPKPTAPAAGTTAPKPAEPGHNHAGGDGHDHDHDHDHGPATALGEQSAGGFTVKASRDGGITPGDDAPVDVWVTGGTAKVSAVRFWIGTQDAKGSVKAKAEIEKDNWHTHVEVPKPLPEGSKLWVEIETDKGEKTVTGFDLKA